MTSPWYKSLIENGKLAEDLEKVPASKKKKQQGRAYRKNTKITGYGSEYHRLYVYVPIDTFGKMKQYCHEHKLSYSAYITSLLDAVFYDKKMMRKYSKWRKGWLKQHGLKEQEEKKKKEEAAQAELDALAEWVDLTK